MEILFLIVGTIFAALAYFGWREVRDIRATGKRVPGQVVAYMQQITARDDRQKFYHAVVRVETPEGPGYVKSAVGSGTPMQPLHARVDVFISAKNPKLALVDSSAINWLIGIVGGLGLTCIIVFFAVFRADWIFAAGAIYVLGQIAYFFYSKHEKATLAIQKFRDVRDKSIFEPIMNQTQFESLRLLEPAQVRAAFVLKKRQAAVGAFVMIALGLGGVIGGERWYHSRTMFLGAAEKAKGRVAAWAESKGSDSTTYYYPLVRYRNPASNEDFTFKHGVGSSHPSWRIGDEVDVLYNPSAPEDAMIDQGRWWNQAGPVALMAFGILFLVLGFKNALYRDPGA